MYKFHAKEALVLRNAIKVFCIVNRGFEEEIHLGCWVSNRITSPAYTYLVLLILEAYIRILRFQEAIQRPELRDAHKVGRQSTCSPRASVHRHRT